MTQLDDALQYENIMPGFRLMLFWQLPPATPNINCQFNHRSYITNPPSAGAYQLLAPEHNQSIRTASKCQILGYWALPYLLLFSAAVGHLQRETHTKYFEFLYLITAISQMHLPFFFPSNVLLQLCD
jgi:hypothetical protein